MTASFADTRLDGRTPRSLSVARHPRRLLRSGTIVPGQEKTAQGLDGSVDHHERMSVINAQRPLATGIDTAVLALKKGQDRLGVAAVDVSRQSAAISESSTKEGQKTKAHAPTPPNPGPPGGAVPGDLAQAMVAQNRETKTDGKPVDLVAATVAQQGASKEIAANTKTVQAFDAMLEELSRAKPTKQADPSA